MELDGEIRDLIQMLDDYIERFNSGKYPIKKVDCPNYRGEYFEKSTHGGIFVIKSVYEDGDRYYFEADSDS